MFDPGVGVGPSLDGAVDALARLDPDRLSDVELGALLVDLDRGQARLDAQRARLVGVWDGRKAWDADRARSGASWLAYRCRTPVGVERARVHLARRLRTMPLVAAAFAEGSICRGHVTALAALRRPATEEAFTRDEALLVTHAQTLQWSAFTTVLAYWLQHADPDGAEPDADARRAKRRLHLSRVGDCWRIDGFLDPASGTIVANAIDRVERELFRQQWADNPEAMPTAAQRRADALVEVCRRACAGTRKGAKPRPLLSILVGEDTFARVCELADGTVITPGTVASDLDDADIERVVWDGPTRITDLGQQRRFVGAARRALELRDRCCTEPGCDAPAQHCEGDHVDPYANGSPTRPDNGRLRCWHHHHRPPKPRGP